MPDTDQDGGFADFLVGEIARLTGYREQYVEARDTADREIAKIDREFDAIDAYEAAKTGQPPTQNPARTTRVRRGSRREELLNLIRNSDGLKRGEILERMGLKGDKSGEMSVSNALTALTKAGHLEREGGKYRMPAAQEGWPTQEQREALAEAAE